MEIEVLVLIASISETNELCSDSTPDITLKPCREMSWRVAHYPLTQTLSTLEGFNVTNESSQWVIPASLNELSITKC